MAKKKNHDDFGTFADETDDQAGRGLGHLLRIVISQQETIMADLTALQAELEDIKSSAATAFAAVQSGLDGLRAQVADLAAQIEDLSAGAVTQDEIDALLMTADEIDATVDSITEAATPAPAPEPAPEPEPIP